MENTDIKNKPAIKSADFITSVANVSTYVGMANEICLCGRSNVGKSTFINMLTGRKIAKTSSVPGKTRLINFFDINKGEYTLVDLPGYGYAKASKIEQDKWKELIESYFVATKDLKQAFVLVDCRINSPLDTAMLKYFYHYNIPFTILATKTDKLTKAELGRRITELAAFLKIGSGNIIPVSHKGEGRGKVIERINQIIEN